MRVLFMGTGEIALPSFRMVAERGDLVGLVTQPDRPVGRSGKPQPPRIKELALEAGVPVLQPERVRCAEAWAGIAALTPELIVVMAYGQILPRRLLDLPPRGCINVHASLLPRHRGASCIQAAIEAGDEESGVTIMHMAEGLDTGDIILAQATRLAPDETGGSLHDRLAEMSPGILREALSLLETGKASRTIQDKASATYAPKLERTDGEIDWTHSASALERRVRAFDPWPGTYTAREDVRGKRRRLKIFPPVVVRAGGGRPGEVLAVDSDGVTVACGEGALELRVVQEDGAKRLPVREFLLGHGFAPGEHFFSLERDRD